MCLVLPASEQQNICGRDLSNKDNFSLCCCAQFVYDAWYSMLTPDREFPREIRRILNTAFGELAGRARQLDVRKMLLGYIAPEPLYNSCLRCRPAGSHRSRVTVCTVSSIVALMEQTPASSGRT